MLDVRFMHREGSTQLTLVLGRAFGQDVTLGGVRTLDRPASASLKALGSRFFGLHFGHLMLRFNTCSGGRFNMNPHFNNPAKLSLSELQLL